MADLTIQQAFDLAQQHHRAGQLGPAEQMYRQILGRQPNHTDALYWLGVVALQVGRGDAAAELIGRAATLRPDDAAMQCDLGAALAGAGRLDEAIGAYRRAIALRPEFAIAYSNLGNALKDKRQLDEAVAAYRQAIVLQANFPIAYSNLGNALGDQGRWDEAIAAYRQALLLKDDFAEAHCNLGKVLTEKGELGEAVAACQRAIALKADFAEAHNNLGNALKNQGKLDEAVACHRRALDLRSNYAVAYNDLSNAEIRSNLLLTLQYRAGVTLGELAEAHAEYDRWHAAPLRGAVAQHKTFHNRDRHGQLRLGFVSPDLGKHPVGYFLVRVLENLDKEQVETICYSDRTVKDDLTRRLQAAATQWRDVVGISDQRLAEQIRADRVDILFDLAGHTAHNRLLVFARKPAPIQITWIGYMCTTGLEAMDYLLADRYEVPESAERYYRERILRMPDGHICYDPPGYAPAVSVLPALAAGHVTFGCFNNPAKVTPLAIEVWAKILRRLPGTRLVLKFKGWNDSSVAQRFAEMFVAREIDPGRLEFLGDSPHAELLGEYGRIDVALDTLPYSGCLTTCEALWMGVPVITCPGETLTSRQSSSCIANAGLTETIARDLDEYVELAVSLAGDLPRLTALRAGLRQRMAASPLCDGKRFATNLMSMLHDVWEQGRLAGG